MNCFVLERAYQVYRDKYDEIQSLREALFRKLAILNFIPYHLSQRPLNDLVGISYRAPFDTAQKIEVFHEGIFQ